MIKKETFKCPYTLMLVANEQCPLGYSKADGDTHPSCPMRKSFAEKILEDIRSKS